ncbi:hypothetical protein [cf. Phormidesmis sp. LEGE 11477]|uniref:hypothetical protein n=1 Tax=cf. Phormidesmis sp. LEGE 11477 TaxID=1828680 RepID=UPI001881EBCA|nr:hypothetical protein [cf. Phormidesmis sp. LEGE 11477]MBE9059675.1 hypothetical protein [cf. Phormidesmis sp. LEGE 11477]
MADPNNIPQEAQQLKEELNKENQDTTENEETSEQTKPEVADTDFDKEYDIAEQNKTGPGNQTSNPSAVGRKDTDAGDHATRKGKVDNIDSPGDSDPDDYMDMAKDVNKNVDAD